ncbi:MAG: hypothetical protein A3G01_04875 [Candidatus Kerfeldbacteria bacterium RIFCSPLOWO2_12_FULL_43_9]|nr:MAG: hypothetical protein A3G01_04875 [Candidatus Kerfeldbacteria bacterium RIFCSPLOWO2_12_FULL_43_9]
MYYKNNFQSDSKNTYSAKKYFSIAFQWSLSCAILILGFSFGILQVQAAWQEPPAGCETPDSPSYDDGACNITPPLNTSAAAQVKLGSLTTGGLISTNGLRIQGGTIDFTGASNVTLGIGVVDTAEIKNATILWEDLNGDVTSRIPDLNSLDTRYDARYVNIPGDSMTGGLQFQTVDINNVPARGVIEINQPPTGKHAICIFESGRDAVSLFVRLVDNANAAALQAIQNSGNAPIALFNAAGGNALQATSTGSNPTISVNSTGTGGGVVATTNGGAVFTGTTQSGTIIAGTTATGTGLALQNITSAPSQVTLTGPSGAGVFETATSRVVLAGAQGAGVFQNNAVFFEMPPNTTRIHGGNITLQGTGSNIFIENGNINIQDGQLMVSTSSPINPAVDVTGNVDVNGNLTAALIEATDHFKGNGIEVRNVESVHNDANDAEGALVSAKIPEIRTAVFTIERLNVGMQTIIPLSDFGIPHDGYTVIPVGLEVLKCPGCRQANNENEVWSEYDPYLGEEDYLRYNRCDGNTWRNNILITNQLQDFSMFTIIFTYYSVPSDNPGNPCGYQNFNFDL